LKGKTQDTTDAPTTEEIGRALKKLENNKAPGTGDIAAKLLKFGGDTLKQWLKHIFSSIWINEEIPKVWLKGIICPLHKKRNQSECANYRGITVLNVTCKAFSNLLYTRPLSHVESKLGHYYAGFHPRKSTINQIFVLQQILEKKKEFRISIYKGIQQGGALSCLLLNITVEYAIRKSGIQTRDTMFYKLIQLVAYSDDSYHRQVFSIIERSFSVT